MPWLIDVSLTNPETGDTVKKRLDFKIDVDSATLESIATLASKVFEKKLPEMMKKAAIISGG